MHVEARSAVVLPSLLLGARGPGSRERHGVQPGVYTPLPTRVHRARDPGDRDRDRICGDSPNLNFRASAVTHLFECSVSRGHNTHHGRTLSRTLSHKLRACPCGLFGAEISHDWDD